MFFWGKDAVHPEGNLLERTGFAKRPSLGLQGTSCYRLPWEKGAIELHGSFAGWIGQEGGGFFIRPLGRCVRWLDSAPPIPGQWPSESYASRADEALQSAVGPLLDWWLAHDAHVAQLVGPQHRENCYRHYQNLPGTRAWLCPELGRAWVTRWRDHSQDLPRARRFGKPDSPHQKTSP